MSQVASTTFGTVKTELYNSGLQFITDNSQSDRAARWINQSYQELCALEKWPFLKTSTTGTSPVSITTLNRIISVRDTVLNNKLVESDIDTLTDLQPNLSVTGTASWYYIDYSSSAPAVTTFPVTINNLEVIYLQNPAPLVNDSDVLIVPDQFVDVVVLGAMRRSYAVENVDSSPQYNTVRAEWEYRLGFMRSQLLARPTYQSVAVYPWSSTDW